MKDPMTFSHDHAIFLVSDPSRLDSVCAAFETAGFLITDRDDMDRESGKTRQRLICFTDGSYIEILTIKDPALRQQHRYAPLLEKGDGWVDYSLVTDDLASAEAACAKAGLPINGPHQHARKLASGSPWGVSLFFAGIGTGHPAMPMVLQDTMGRDLRIPGERTDHPNGATGILGTTLVVRDPKEGAARLSALLGPGAETAGADGASSGSRFHVKDAWVDIVGPGGPQSTTATRLAEWGEGLASVSLRAPNIQQTQTLQPLGPASLIHLSPSQAEDVPVSGVYSRR